jgi:hypothetical protein
LRGFHCRASPPPLDQSLTCGEKWRPLPCEYFDKRVYPAGNWNRARRERNSRRPEGNAAGGLGELRQGDGRAQALADRAGRIGVQRGQQGI